MTPHHEHGPRGWSTLRHVGPVLIDGWPWGWGADRVGQTAPEPWLCASCGAKGRPAGAGPLVFAGELLCTSCARARCVDRFDRCRLAVPVPDAHVCPVTTPQQLTLGVA